MKKKKNLRIFYLKLIRWRKNILIAVRFFFHWINRKITLIYFFNENEKSIVREWDVKKIFSLLSLFLIMLFLGIHYLVTYQSRKDILVDLEKENLKLDDQIERLEDRVEKISSYQEKYNKQMLKIYQHFGDIDGQSLWEKAARSKDIELIQDTWNLKDMNWLTLSTGDRLNSIEKINQSRIQILLNLNQLKEIDKYMTLTEKMADHIPTGWPIRNKIGYKTSGFGNRFSPFTERREFHTGIDIAAATGNVLIATADGVVLFSGDKRTFGNVIIIRHDFGYRTIYAHNSINLVKNGERIKKNQKIGEVGNTGRSTGSHVHYEIRIGKQYVDPWPYVVGNFY